MGMHMPALLQEPFPPLQTPCAVCSSCPPNLLPQGKTQLNNTILAKPVVDGEDMGIQPSMSAQVLNGENVKDLHGDASDESDDEVIDLGDYEPRRHQTMGEKLIAHANLLREFADSILYQVQFNNHWWVEMLEHKGGSLFRLASSCLNQECQFSSTRGTLPMMWERAMTSAMYYRTRLPHREAMS